MEMKVAILEEQLGKGKTTIENDGLWYKIQITSEQLQTFSQRYRDELNGGQLAIDQQIEDLNRQIEKLIQTVPDSDTHGFALSHNQVERQRIGTKTTELSKRIDQLEKKKREIEQKRELLETKISEKDDTFVWIGEGAFSKVIISWEAFLDLLEEFEKEYAQDPLRTRLSRLRQIGAEPDIAADDAIGTGDQIKDRTNRQERKVDTSKWQLLLEAKAVAMPNGEIIDIHHFILGLDALALPKEKQSKNKRVGKFLASANIGESFSAVTWSGDVGAAVVAYIRHVSQSWEQHKRPNDETRKQFYYDISAPDSDLLADIDAWGTYGDVPKEDNEKSNFKSIKDILIYQYGGEEQSAEEYESHIKKGRGLGVMRFLEHYGFTSVTKLTSQPAVKKVREQVEKLSMGWYQAREQTIVFKSISTIDEQIAEVSVDMTNKYLEWLEQLAKDNQVTDETYKNFLSSQEGAKE